MLYKSIIRVLFAAFVMCFLAACAPDVKKIEQQTESEEPGGNTEPSDSTGPGENTLPADTLKSFGAYKHVVIVGVDGGGAFFKDTDTPRCDEIFNGQATTYTSRTGMPSMSAEGWGAILHGVLPQFHGLTNSIIETTPYPTNSPYPSIFRVAREAMPDADLASFVEWNPINIGIVENNLGVYKDTGEDDAEVTGKILAYLKGKSPALMFVQFSSPDDVGEAKGFGSDIYLATLSTVDALVGRIYDQLKLKGLLDETLFIVTADHGGINKTHGGDSDAERNVFLGVAGKTVADGAIVDAEGRDVAAIAAYALGLECPENWTGHVPAGVFRDVTEVGERKEMDLPGTEYRNHETEPTPALSNMETLLAEHNDPQANAPDEPGVDITQSTASQIADRRRSNASTIAIAVCAVALVALTMLGGVLNVGDHLALAHPVFRSRYSQ